MINYNIDFTINKKTTIRICLEENLNLLDCCCHVDMILLYENKQYLLSGADLKDNMYILKNVLKKVLNNQLQLHLSIIQDIGYLYNEKLRLKPGLVYEKFENRAYWVGGKHLLWGCDLVTWLYNDSDGNIILHITPFYTGDLIDNGEDDDEEADARAYESWMATEYKPFYTTVISSDTARLWLRLAENIYNKIQICQPRL